MTALVYDDIADVVEDLVRIKSKKFAKGFLAADDIAQEIRIKCYLSIGSYNKEKGQSMKTFLNVCTENHLRNLMRDRFAKFDPPCKNRGCTHFHPNGQPNDDAYKCGIFNKYMVKYGRKCATRMPARMDESWAEDSRSMFDDKAFDYVDIEMSVREALHKDFPGNFDEMYGYYNDLMNGRFVRQLDKQRIQKSLSFMLEK